MRLSPTIKKNSIITVYLCFAIALPFATTFLLDLQVIQQNIARQVLIYLLMIVEMYVFVSLFINELKH
jgi:hypothetical protein